MIELLVVAMNAAAAAAATAAATATAAVAAAEPRSLVVADVAVRGSICGC